jgi:hypothetical protein
MVVTTVKHNAPILIGDYPFADRVKEQVLDLLEKGVRCIPQENSNVKASIHTAWDWEFDNITFRNLREYITAEIERTFRPGARSGDNRRPLVCDQFWANVYKKGDWANEHCHKPYHYSFAYFVKSKWYDSPLVFAHSGKKIRPKEGRFVAFPAYLRHLVPKHRYKDTRITLSANLWVKLA